MVQYMTRRMRQFVLMLVLLGFIPTEKAFPAEKIEWKGSEPKTGNRMADLEIRSTGISPSYEEMKYSLNLKSKSGIHRLISALEERGFIKRLAHKARALEVIKLPETASANDIYNSFSPSVIKG